MKKVDIRTLFPILDREVRKYTVPIVDLIAVEGGDPFKVLVATILSARTKDGTTAVAVRKLFARVKNFDELERLSVAQIEKLIFPVGFYRTKARHLKLLPQVVQEKFGGGIPQTVEALVELPGVGRKTANLVVARGFNKPAICCDVHMVRVLNRLGYIKTRGPLDTEMTLRKILPQQYWVEINRVIVAFGQHVCTPVSPWCSKCPVRMYCNRVGVSKSR